MSLDAVQIRALVVVASALLGRECRREAFGVEVADLDRVAAESRASMAALRNAAQKLSGRGWQ